MNQPFLPENGDFFTGFLPILWGNGGLWVARQPVPQVVPAGATRPQVQGRAGPGRSRRSETPQDDYNNRCGLYQKERALPSCNRPSGRGSYRRRLGEDGGNGGLVGALRGSANRGRG